MIQRLLILPFIFALGGCVSEKAKQKQAAEAVLDKIAEKIVLYERQIGDANNQMDEAMQTMRTTAKGGYEFCKAARTGVAAYNYAREKKIKMAAAYELAGDTPKSIELMGEVSRGEIPLSRLLNLCP